LSGVFLGFSACWVPLSNTSLTMENPK